MMNPKKKRFKVPASAMGRPPAGGPGGGGNYKKPKKKSKYHDLDNRVLNRDGSLRTPKSSY